MFCLLLHADVQFRQTSFHAAGTNGSLYLSLPRCASCCPTNCPCSTWSGSWIAQFTKESVTSTRQSSAGWMPARTGKSFVGMWCKHPVTMCKASLRMLSMRQVCVLRYQTGAQYSAVEWTRDRVEMRNVSAPGPHLDPASHLNSMTQVKSFLCKASRW